MDDEKQDTTMITTTTMASNEDASGSDNSSGGSEEELVIIVDAPSTTPAASSSCSSLKKRVSFHNDTVTTNNEPAKNIGDEGNNNNNHNDDLVMIGEDDVQHDDVHHPRHDDDTYLLRHRSSSSSAVDDVLSSMRSSMASIIRSSSSSRGIISMNGGTTTTKDKNEDDDDWTVRWRPWVSWSQARIRWTYFGMISSCSVLAIRLILDSTPTVYVIHSVIVFFDMVLIHLFTNSHWLSISGEIVTILCFLGFFFTKQTVFELLETTMLAILCSFHLINSRSKHMEECQEVKNGMEFMYKSSRYLLENIHEIANELDAEDTPDSTDDLEEGPRQQRNKQHDKVENDDDESTLPPRWLVPPNKRDDERTCHRHKQKIRLCGQHFFEHFLDGSAGVMYTSFLGLILDELIKIGQGTKDY